MALETKRWHVRSLKSLQTPIEQRAMSRPHVARQGFFVDGEAVILAGDEDATRIQILHRMIRAVVAEFHLDGFRAGRDRKSVV